MTGRVRLSLVCGAVALCVAAPASAFRDGTAAQRVEYSVGYVSLPQLRAVIRAQRATVVWRVPALRIARVLAGPAFPADASRLLGVRFVERVTRRSRSAEPALELASGNTLPWEWQYTAAHEDGVPDRVLRAADAITIAVIDTGADLSAPDIAAKSPVAFNTRTGTGDVRDSVGHGTFVAALAAGSTTNGEGIAGFGGDAGLMVVKAGPDGSFTDVDEASGIAFAVDHGARIINLSFGGTRTSSTEQSAIDYAAKHGVLMVAAAGNQYLAGDPPVYPAALLQPVGSKGVGGTGLSIGASTASGTRAVFSNAGTYLSLTAPGEGVFSAVSSTAARSSFPSVPLPGSLAGLYGYASGTSFAAPEVAGAAALVMAANPLLTAAAVAQILKESASGHGTWSPDLGYGVLDVGNAVQLALNTQAQLPQAVLKLVAQPEKRQVVLTATLSSLVPGISTTGRSIAFDRYTKRRAWKRLGTLHTGAAGRAVWKLPDAKAARVKVRARWTGATDLAPAASRVLAVRSLR